MVGAWGTLEIAHGKGGDAARMLPAISLGIHGVEQGAGIGFHIVGLDVGIQDFLDLRTLAVDAVFKRKSEMVRWD